MWAKVNHYFCISILFVVLLDALLLLYLFFVMVLPQQLHPRMGQYTEAFWACPLEKFKALRASPVDLCRAMNITVQVRTRRLNYG